MPARSSGEKQVRKQLQQPKKMNNNKAKLNNRIARHKRIRSRIFGTAERPRISVFKSNRHISVQFIDDNSHKTLLSGKAVSAKGKSKGSKTDKATEMGKMLAEKAKAAGIKEAVFDRGGFKFHGRVKAVAEGLRAGGLKV